MSDALINNRYQIIGQRLKWLREEFGKYSQQEVAQKLGVSKSAYNEYESGKKRINIDVLIELSYLYNMPTDYIIMPEKYTVAYLKEKTLNLESEIETALDFAIEKDRISGVKLYPQVAYMKTLEDMINKCLSILNMKDVDMFKAILDFVQYFKK